MRRGPLCCVRRTRRLRDLWFVDVSVGRGGTAIFIIIIIYSYNNVMTRARVQYSNIWVGTYPYNIISYNIITAILL